MLCMYIQRDFTFQPPVPAEKWENVLNATQNAPLCPQPTGDPVSEDCLFLNVYSTKVSKELNNDINKDANIKKYVGRSINL